MPKSLHQRLLEKGWTEEEIGKTMELLYSQEKKDKHMNYLTATHPTIYWVGLVIAIVGNLLLAVTLIPFLMVLNSLQLYIILGIVGFVFGSMFNHILRDIEQVDQKHHIVAGVFIPSIALITIYIMISVANKFNDVIKNSNPHNAVLLSIIYLACFSAPYVIYKVRDLMWEKKHKAAGAV